MRRFLLSALSILIVVLGLAGISDAAPRPPRDAKAVKVVLPSTATTSPAPTAPAPTVTPSPSPAAGERTVADSVITPITQPVVEGVVEPVTAVVADAVTPAVPVAPCEAPATRLVPVGTSTDLKAAVAAALPGDRIVLADGLYSKISITRSGTADGRIRLCGGPGAVLDGGSVLTGYVVTQRASYWDLSGFTVRNGQKGIVLDASSHNVLTGLTVTQVGDEAVHFRTHSSDNAIVDSTISQTGLRDPRFGEGVYIGSASNNWCTYTACAADRSDRNVVRGNRISSVAAEAVDVKEGSSGGVVEDNVFDGTGSSALAWVDIKGNGYRVVGNSGRVSTRDGFLTTTAVTGWGIANVFLRNTADVQGPGYGFNMRAGNTVGCDNTVRAAAKGLANVACSVS